MLACPQEAYWRHHAAAKSKLRPVEYGNDVEGTAFAEPDMACPLGSSAWNLAVGAPQPSCSRLNVGLVSGKKPGAMVGIHLGYVQQHMDGGSRASLERLLALDHRCIELHGNMEAHAPTA